MYLMRKGFTIRFYFPIIFLFSALVLNAQNTWTQKANYGAGNREAACSFAIGNTGYFMTGLHGDSDYCDVWAWSQASNTWAKKDTFPGGIRMGASGVSLNGYGYLIGGERPSNCFATKGFKGGLCGGAFYTDFWRYTPDSDKWTRLADFPGAARNYAVMVADPLDTAIYFGTGNNNTVNFLYDWWVYKTATATWTQLDSFPGGQRCYAVGFLTNGNIYVGTGHDNDNKENATSDMWQYSPATSAWKRVANVPGTVRRQASAFAIGNMGYVCLGTRANSIYMNDMWQYNAVQDTWTTAAAFPPGQAFFANGLTIGNKGYIGTGTYGSNLDDTSWFWEYTPGDSTVGINEIKNNAGVNVFPNPSNGLFQLRIINYELGMKIAIYNILGEQVCSSFIIYNSQFTIDLSALPDGIYFYKLTGSDKKYSGKIIIAR
jgi:N-acetylneuraminic acid mutarotase